MVVIRKLVARLELLDLLDVGLFQCLAMKRLAIALSVILAFCLGRLTAPNQGSIGSNRRYEVRSFYGMPMRVDRTRGTAEIIRPSWIPGEAPVPTAWPGELERSTNKVSAIDFLQASPPPVNSWEQFPRATGPEERAPGR